jgi:uncharacterized membrane protein HdeD (DUF308 family)
MNAVEQQFATDFWWVLTVRGVLAILFGIAAVFWPGITILTLLYLFSAYVLVGGIVDIVQGISGVGKGGMWFLTLILGFLEMGVGVYLLRHPGVSFATFILLIGFTLIFRGVFEVIGAFGDHFMASHRAMLIIGGVLSALAGILMLFQPAAAGVAFVWIVGLYALITGPILIALSLDLKKAGQVVVVE